MSFKELLKERGIKPKWIADKVGVQRLEVYRWMKGTSYPKQEYIDKILKIFRKGSALHVFGEKPKRSDFGKKRK